MKIGMHSEASLKQTEKTNWVKRQIMKRELNKLGKEIERVRALLNQKYAQRQDFQNPAVRMVSAHLDYLIFQYQNLDALQSD